MNQIAKDEQLFDAARDYFYFVTTFFEPINISATHIYHSALELSPVSSVARKLYYHQRPTPFPRVAIGVIDSWDWSIVISSIDYCESSVTWSPCGQFVATQTKEAVEIRDVLAFELLFTLRPARPTSQLTGTLAYSPDGRSLACASPTAIIIWDIQTGGVVKELKYDKPSSDSLVWSSDGGSISATIWDRTTHTLTVRGYDVTSGTLFPTTLQSRHKPQLWAHDKSFRVMTTARDGEACTIDILGIGPAPKKVESFSIRLGEGDCRIESISPTTYHISISVVGNSGRLLVLDTRSSRGLLDEEGSFEAHCFSPDGKFFAASRLDSFYTWRYDDGHYIPGGKFPTLAGSCSNLLFSPSSSSVLGNLGEMLKLWRLDGPSVDSAIHSQQLAIFSRSGTYIATTYLRESIVETYNSFSPTPSQFIDTDIEVFGLGLTNNVLLVVGSEVVVAWLLTEEGVVNGVFGSRRAGRSDSIWTVSTPQRCSDDPKFLIEGEIGVIKSDGNILHVYNTRTGEAQEPTQALLHSSGPWYSLMDIMKARHHLYDGSVHDAPPGDDWKPSQDNLKEGWMKDREGRHLMWLPVEWRAADWNEVEWFSDIATIQFGIPHFGNTITKLY